MNALEQRRERVAYAKSLGVAKPSTLKKDALEQAIADAEALNATELGTISKEISEKPITEDDPFDEIDPELEGDHLPEAQVTETEALTDALGEREATREAWLIAAVTELAPLIAQAGGVVEQERVRVSVGFPSKSIRKVIGQCWTPEASDDGKLSNLFISPVLDNPVEVLAVLAHELVHHANHLEGHCGHGKEFGKIAKTLGLEGKMTETRAGDALKETLKEIATALGPYPHTKLNLNGPAAKKQTTRLLKLECLEVDCLAVDPEDDTKKLSVRITKKWVEMGMVPQCPACKVPMGLSE